MNRRVQLKVLAATVLIATAVVQHAFDTRNGVLTLAFGLFNALVSPPGTAWVRAIAVGATLTEFVVPDALILLAALTWLIWPPAYMIAWGLGSRADAGQSRTPALAAASARIAMAGLVLAVAIASAAYRVIVMNTLQQTAALFIGIPALLAIAVILVVSPASARGVACKAVTVGLLFSLLFLGEGIMCVVMSAPLFYAVALVIADGTERARSRGIRQTTTLSCVVLLAVLPMSLEGVTDRTTVNRNESVTESRVVHASQDAVGRALFAPPRFDRELPAYLRSGFPSAVATRIERDANGTRWVIQMRGGEMRLNGMEPRTGELVLALDESHPGMQRWRAVSDTSHMTHFLNWRESIVQWDAIDAQTTRVTWTLNYRRGLDPSWYFGPMERYAMHLAAGYLIDTVATP